MISKATIKFVHSLELKKNRNRERLFVAEGPKVVVDLATVVRPKLIIATPEWLTQHHGSIQTWGDTEVCEVTEEELRKASFLKHPQQVMALFPMREEPTTFSHSALPSRQLCLALDDIQDPGNLGTIIRIADWFGIEHIFCSKGTADVYNPKVVQATMGSIARVQLHYTDLYQLITALPSETPVYGTLLDGQNIYTQELTSHGFIVMGNEGNGISPDIRKLVTRRILIPNYPVGRASAESLNVAIATAITCAEFRRKTS